MATKGDQIRNLVKALGGEPRNSTVEDAIEDLVGLFEEKRYFEATPIVSDISFNISDPNSEKRTSADAIPLDIGETYIVDFDGTKYNCVAFMRDTGDEQYYMLGNGHLKFDQEDDTGEPFALFVTSEMYRIYAIATETGDHTYSIAQESERTVRILDPKNIKNDGDLVFEVKRGFPSTITTEDIELVEGSVDTFIDSYLSGKRPNCILRFHNQEYGYAFSYYEIKGQVSAESRKFTAKFSAIDDHCLFHCVIHNWQGDPIVDGCWCKPHSLLKE